MKLNDSMTTFIVPFNFGDCNEILAPNEKSKWELSTLKIDNGAIYPHVQDFLTANILTKDNLISQKCVIYSLKDSWKNISSEESSILKLIQRHISEITVKQHSEETQIQFRFLNEKKNLSSPKILLYPQALIGLLIFSIELTPDYLTISNLISLNYNLAKTDVNQTSKISIVKTSDSPELDKELNSIYSSLSKYSSSNRGDSSVWQIDELIKFLLTDFCLNSSSINIFNKTRIHLFTYLQAESDEINEDLKRGFMLIARCQNEKYNLSKEDLDSDLNYKQLFENISIASFVEGASLMTIVNANSPTHVTNFKKGTLIPRYLWIYLLVYIQRHSIIGVIKELMQIDLDVSYKSKNNLKAIVARLSKMKINTYFTDISDHSQHNVFYHFCANKLKIKEHLNEVSSKIRDLEAILQEQLGEMDKDRNNKWEKFLASMMGIPIILTFLTLINFKFVFSCTQVVMSMLSFIIIITLGLLLFLIFYYMRQSKSHKNVK